MIIKNNKKVLDYIQANIDISKLFKYYINHNISFDNPYHNLNHTFEMMQLIIMNFENDQANNPGESPDVYQLYVLLISSLFHDYNHSKGLYNDTINVYNAKLGLIDAINSTLDDKSDDFKRKLINDCCEIINATEYPYIINDEELTYEQRIIRECDILVSLYDDFLSQTIFGLKSEMQGKDFYDFISKETVFLLESYKNLSLPYSKFLVKEHSESVLEELNILCNIIK